MQNTFNLKAPNTPASYVYYPEPSTPTPSGGGRLVHSTMRVENQTRNWCFTVNNYLNSDETSLQDLAKHEDTRYLIYGREIAPVTGTPHLQGFIQFKKKKRFSTVKGLLPIGAHVEAAKGSAFQAAEYCSKEDSNPFEFVNLV